MRAFEEKQMTWRQFELLCVDLVASCFPADSFNVVPQRSYTSRNEGKKRIDIYISESRWGWGKRYVIDCKHYPKEPLDEHQINSTLRYKKDVKASAAIMLISGASKNFDKKFGSFESYQSYAQRQGVYVIQVSAVNSELVRWLRNITPKRDLRRIVSR